MKKITIIIIVNIFFTVASAQTIPYEKLDSISNGISKLQSEMDGKSYYDSTSNFEMSFPEINFKVNFYNQLASRAIYKKTGNKEILALTENIDLSKAIGIVSYLINKEFIKVSLYFPKEYLKTQIIEDGKVIKTITQEWISFFCTNDKHTFSISKALFYLCTRIKKEKGLMTENEIAEQKRDINTIPYEAYILKYPASLYTMHAKYYLRLQEEKKLIKEKQEVEREEVAGFFGKEGSSSGSTSTPSGNANPGYSEKTITSPAEVQKFVFNDDFSDNQNKWFEEETDKFSFRVTNGKYRIQSKKGGSWLSSLPIKFSTNKDFEISASIRKISGTDGYYFGIILGKNGSTGYNHFAGVTGWGNYVFADKGPTPEDVIPTTENTTVLKGNATNYIVIKKEKGFIKLLINGRLMGQTVFDKFYGDLFGFQVWSGDESLIIEVDKLTIKSGDD